MSREQETDALKHLTISERKSKAASGDRDCPKCEQGVPKSNFPQHVRTCHGGAE